MLTQSLPNIDQTLARPKWSFVSSFTPVPGQNVTALRTGLQRLWDLSRGCLLPSLGLEGMPLALLIFF